MLLTMTQVTSTPAATELTIFSTERPRWSWSIIWFLMCAGDVSHLLARTKNDIFWLDAPLPVLLLVIFLLYFVENWRLEMRDPRLLVIDDEGLSSPRFGVGRIFWSRILDCSTIYNSKTAILRLFLDANAPAQEKKHQYGSGVEYVLDIDLRTAPERSDLEHASSICRSRIDLAKSWLGSRE